MSKTKATEPAPRQPVGSDPDVLYLYEVFGRMQDQIATLADQIERCVGEAIAAKDAVRAREDQVGRLDECNGTETASSETG